MKTQRLDGKPKWTRYAPHLRMRAKELLAEGLSLGRVSRETGIGVGVLSFVRRGIYWQQDDAPVEEVLSSGNKGRCPKCGHMVWLPCIACGMQPKE